MRISNISYRIPYSWLIACLLDIYFLTYCALWLVVHFFRSKHRPLPLVNDWLTDLVFLPFVFHVALSATRYILNDQSYMYPLQYLLGIWLYASIVFEFIIPLYSAEAISDPFDVMAYLLGTVFFYQLHQRRPLVIS